MKKTKLVIGCPTFERAWALPLWFDCIAAQNFPVDEIAFCFAYSKSYDGTFDVLQNRGSQYNELFIYQFDLPTYSDRNLDRLPVLASLRNGFLEMVKETDADWFLSWDDDILFPPNTVHKLWEPAKVDNAVGAFIDMGGNDELMAFPSIMHFPQALGEIAFRRPISEYDLSKPVDCDIIMAVKLMGREVYMNTAYRWDPTGEDIGWSHSCEEHGYSRYLHPGVRGIHLYDKHLSVEIMKTFPQAEYPELLYPLSRWWRPRDQWSLT